MESTVEARGGPVHIYGSPSLKSPDPTAVTTQPAQNAQELRPARGSNAPGSGLPLTVKRVVLS